MRKFLAGLLGMVLCVQTVYGIPVRAADVFELGRKTESYAGCDPAGGFGADEQRQFGQSDRSGTIC